MVQRVPALLLFVVFEQRKVHHPERCPGVFQQAQIVRQSGAQGAEGIVHDARLAGAEEDQVASGRPGAFQRGLHGGVRQEFQDGRLQALASPGQVIDLDVSQSLGAVFAHKGGVIVDLLAGERVAARQAQSGHPAVGLPGRPGEDLEFHLSHHIAEFHQLQGVAQIRPVRAVAPQGLGVAQARKGVAQVYAFDLLEQGADQVFHQLHHIVLFHERHLHIQLSELRLPVGAQVLVAKTADDLVVAVQA